jgi:ankyrin repeat protein
MLERIQDGRTDLVFELVAAGSPPTLADADGVTLIRWCAYYGDVSAIRFLVQAGAPLSSLGPNLELNGACFHGHWRLCQFLLENAADANHPMPDTGEVPLHAALSKPGRADYDNVVRVLLAAGADPNRHTKPRVPTDCFMRDCVTYGETPLHRAAAFGSVAAIEMLLAAGATIDAKDMDGDSPLGWASWHLRPAVVLKKLTYGSHRISDSQVTRSNCEHGAGNGMDLNLIGKPRTDR